jgi:hypothetical protein
LQICGLLFSLAPLRKSGPSFLFVVVQPRERRSDCAILELSTSEYGGDAADAFEAFTEAKGPYDPAVAKRLRDNVFDVGNTVDPADGYRAFRGRDPGIGALMRKRGFPVPNP